MSDAFAYLFAACSSTLRAVIDYYDRGGGPRPGKSPFLMKIGLNEGEKRDLVSFLLSLTDTPAARTH